MQIKGHNGGSGNLMFTSLINIVLLEQLHHKLMVMYDGGFHTLPWVCDKIAPMTEGLWAWWRWASQIPYGGLKIKFTILLGSKKAIWQLSLFKTGTFLIMFWNLVYVLTKNIKDLQVHLWFSLNLGIFGGFLNFSLFKIGFFLFQGNSVKSIIIMVAMDHGSLPWSQLAPLVWLLQTNHIISLLYHAIVFTYSRVLLISSWHVICIRM